MQRRLISSLTQKLSSRRSNSNPIVFRCPDSTSIVDMETCQITISTRPTQLHTSRTLTIRNPRPHKPKQPPINRLPLIIQIILHNTITLRRITRLHLQLALIRDGRIRHIQRPSIGRNPHAIRRDNLIRRNDRQQRLLRHVETPDSGVEALAGKFGTQDVLDGESGEEDVFFVFDAGDDDVVARSEGDALIGVEDGGDFEGFWIDFDDRRWGSGGVEFGEIDLVVVVVAA